MNKSDVFLSYRRVDKVFTQKLDQALKGEGLEVWVDWEDIPPGSTDFTQDIKDGIEGADVFIAVLSPSYLESPYCMGELAMAIELHKRIVPIVWQKFDVSQVPPEVSHINWVYFTPHVGDENEFDDAFPVLMEAILSDQEYLANHTRLFLRAKEWEEGEQKPEFLLSGAEIDDAERWLAQGGDKDPPPTQVHSEYIFASRARQRQQQRALLTGVSFALIFSLVLTVISVFLYRDAQSKRAELDVAYGNLQALADDLEVQRDLAEREREESRSLLWATYAIEALDGDNTLLALPLALEANSIENPPALSQRALASVAYSPGPRSIFPVGGRAGEERHALWALDLNNEMTAFAAGTSSGVVSIWDANGALEPFWSHQVHEASIWDVAYTPDDTQIVTTSADGRVLVWDVETKEQAAELTGHEDTIWSLDFDRNGRYLAGGSIDGHVYVWDYSTGELLHTLGSGGDHVWVVRFGAGNYLVAGSNHHQITVWDSHTFELLREMDASSAVWSLAYNPEETRLYSGHADGSIRVWDIDSGARRSTYTGHDDRVLALEVNPRTEELLSASADGNIITWDGNTVANRYEGHNGMVWDLAYDNDGATFYSASADSTVIAWDTASRAIVDDLQTDIDDLTAMAINTESENLAIGSADRTILQRNLADGTVNRFSTLHTDSVNDLAYSPDGTIILSAGDTRVLVWDALTGFNEARMTGHTEKVQTVAYHPTEPLAISGSSDNSIILWDLETYEMIRAYRGHSGTVLEVAFSPDGETFASASADRDVIVWDVESGEMLHNFTDHRDVVYSVNYSPDGDMLASGSNDNTIYLYDMNNPDTEPIRFTGHTLGVNHISFNSDSTLLVSGDEGGQIIIWDMEGNPIRIYDTDEMSVVATVFSPHHENRVISAQADGTLTTWRADGLPLLIEWTRENRGLRLLNCYQRDLYQLPTGEDCGQDAIDDEDAAPPPPEQNATAGADSNE